MEEYTTVFAWGGDHFGQLGLGGKTSGKTYASPRFCSFNILIKAISCGEEHSAFISSTGHVYTMGSNTDGRLGIGSKSVKQSASPCLVEDLVNYNCLKISCGWGHTVVITEIGELFAWGVGEYGALGNGSTDNKYSPCLVNNFRGNVLDISCGSRHTGIILQDRNGKKLLAMCGGGEAGQLGTGKREKELSPVIIEFFEDIEQVSCGVFHSAFLTTKGQVFTMGGNSFGQLGLGNKKSQSRPEKVQHLENTVIKKVRCSNFTAALSDKGYLYVWGSGVFGEYLLPHRWSIREPVVDIEIGSGFGVALDNNSNVYVWGSNSNGELGLDDYDPRLTPSIIPSLKGKSIKKIACGGNFCLGLGEDKLTKVKTPEKHIRKSEPRKSEEPTEIYGRKVDEMDRLSFEVKQTYKSYEEIKRNFENLSERYEIEKRNSEKHIEELTREIVRYKNEIEKYKNQADLSNKEIRELSQCVEDLRKENFNAEGYREELLRLKRNVDENKLYSKNELKMIEGKSIREIQELEEKVMQENFRRKQCEKELERANSLIYGYEDTIRNCQDEINEISLELQENMKKNEQEKKKNQFELEKSYKEINELIRKNELMAIEKEKIQSVLKNELEKYFKENKELKFQLEINRDKLHELSVEHSEVKMHFEGLKQEKEKIQSTSKGEFEKVLKENSEIRRKLEIAVHELHSMESLKNEYGRLRNENSEVLNKLDYSYHENDKLTHEVQQLHKESLEIKQKLDLALGETRRIDQLNSEIERLSKENSQLLKKTEHLTNEKEKIATELTTEIEELSHQKADLTQKFDQLYLEKEKKNYAFTHEIEKFSRENLELKKRIEEFAVEKEKEFQNNLRVSEENTKIIYENESFLSENRKLSKAISELEYENHELLNKMNEILSEKENVSHKFKYELENLSYEKEKKSSDLSRINEELTRISNQNETLSSENRKINLVLKDLSFENTELKSKIVQVQTDKESIVSRLRHESEILQKDIIDLKRNLDISNKEKESLLKENVDIKKNLENYSKENESFRREISENKRNLDQVHREKESLKVTAHEEKNLKTVEITRLSAQVSMLERENAANKKVISDQSTDLQSLQDHSHHILSENNRLKQALEDSKYDLERMRHKESDQEHLMSNARDTLIALESKNAELLDENHKLGVEISELESKNRQLLENLERELTQRAKEYKERTMSLLSTPGRSGSPYMRPPTPYEGGQRGRLYNRTSNAHLERSMEVNRTFDEDSGNTAAKLLQTLEDSPGRVSQKTAVRRTPTKEDIKTRITALMNNRNKIESEINKLDQE